MTVPVKATGTIPVLPDGGYDRRWASFFGASGE
jgi:hypothetical protein